MTALDSVLVRFLGEDILKATLLPPPVPSFMGPTPLPHRASAVVKVCSNCGRRHDALSWARLEFVGHQDDGDGGWLILRNCQCGGTISLQAEDPHEG